MTQRQSDILYWCLVGGGTLLIVLSAFWMGKANARDSGQWETTEPHIRQWYQELRQPDNPRMSCCGEADAYYADRLYTKDGKNIAVITDTREDEPLRRPHVPVGTEIEIPNHKYKYDRGNPTGHSVIFLTLPDSNGVREVYCFVDGTGV